MIDRIRHALRPLLGGDADVTHIGSTAVPGMPAKDLLDLMLAVPTLAEADRLAEALGSAGLPRRAGEWHDNARGLPGKTWPKRLHGSADPGRPVNLHVRVTGSPGWRFALLMRDHLRAVPAARDEYAAAKLQVGGAAQRRGELCGGEGALVRRGSGGGPRLGGSDRLASSRVVGPA